MTINEYQKLALRTASEKCMEDPLLNGVLGLTGESGECADLVKKSIFQGHIISDERMAKELGDVAWYLAISSYAIGYDLEDVLKMNIEKLRARYPDGFHIEESTHRKEGDV